MKRLLFKEKSNTNKEVKLAIELTDDEMKSIEGASSDYLEHFYENQKLRGPLDPIYKKTI